MSKELKPCPFCGSNRIVEETETDNSGCVPMTVWFVKCTACGSFKNSISNPDRAIKRWNTRPAEDALNAENERLKEALKEIREIADKGLDIGIEFIGAGLDGMTGGVEDWEAMKRARRKIRRLAKQALNAPDTA